MTNEERSELTKAYEAPAVTSERLPMQVLAFTQTVKNPYYDASADDPGEETPQRTVHMRIVRKADGDLVLEFRRDDFVDALGAPIWKQAQEDIIHTALIAELMHRST